MTRPLYAPPCARDDLTAKATSLFAVARAVRDRLDRGGTLSRQMLSQLMREQFGESDASGIWSMRDAYDALETAQVLLALAPGSPLIDAGDRWLATRWAQLSDDGVTSTAAMMVDFLRRIAAPEVTP